MEEVITKISHKWSALQWYERKYFASWFFIYLLMVVTETLSHLDIGGKLLFVIPLLLAMVHVLYFLWLPYLAKTIPIDLPYAKLLSSKDHWNKFRARFILPLLPLSVMPNINKNLLGWAPLWVKLVFMIALLFLFSYSTLFPKPIKNENLTNQGALRIENEKTFNALVIAFVIIICIIGGLVYYDLHK